jgi:addiction module HigA family antidote
LSRHPGKILLKDYMNPNNLSANGLAAELDVPPNRISSIVNGSRAITADTALRLARYFRTEPMYWLELQNTYELARAKEESGQDITANVKRGPSMSVAA